MTYCCVIHHAMHGGRPIGELPRSSIPTTPPAFSDSLCPGARRRLGAPSQTSLCQELAPAHQKSDAPSSSSSSHPPRRLRPLPLPTGGSDATEAGEVARGREGSRGGVGWRGRMGFGGNEDWLPNADQAGFFILDSILDLASKEETESSFFLLFPQQMSCHISKLLIWQCI
jgi:hypothetical protein